MVRHQLPKLTLAGSSPVARSSKKHKHGSVTLPCFLLSSAGTRTRQGASVKQTRSVCSERARTPAGGRSRCGFAKRTRGFSAQTISSIWMRCLSNLSRPCAASTDPLPHRGESNSMQGAAVKKTPWQRRPGHAFPMAAQAESPSRNPRSERDALSQRRSKRKAHPGISPQTGTHFPLHLPPQKTCALANPKLGRRRPKRNRRRSI